MPITHDARGRDSMTTNVNDEHVQNPLHHGFSGGNHPPRRNSSCDFANFDATSVLNSSERSSGHDLQILQDNVLNRSSSSNSLAA